MQNVFYNHNEDQGNVTEESVNIYGLFNQTADWGPKRDPLYIVIPITVIYLAIFLSGILGNVSTCFVIARNKCMHTATNYYLFSLAISDLLLLLSGLPPEIYSIWSRYPYIFGEAFCVLQGFIAETSANATVLTITAFTVERYIAICHPFLSHTWSKLNRAIKFIILIWAIALGLAIPQAMALGIICEVVANGYVIDEHCVCMIKREIIPHAFLISTLLFFVTPMSLITVLYILIGLQLRKSSVGTSRVNSIKMKRQKVYKPVAYAPQVLVGDETQQQDNQEEEGRKNFARNAQATKHVVKMLVAVVVAFFICWAPFHAQRLLAMYAGNEDIAINYYMVMAFKILTYISGIFYYLSTTVNPLLYHIMSNKFREAFKKTYKHLCKKGHKIPVGRCYSTLSAHHQSYSDSYSGGGWGRGGSIRYNEGAIAAHLHDHRRPLVVSFRRQKRALQQQEQKVVGEEENGFATGGSKRRRRTEDKDSYTTLRTSYSFSNPSMAEKMVIEKSRSFCKEKTDQSLSIDFIRNGYKPEGSFLNDQYISERPGRSCCYVEVHNLRPKHICPLSNRNKTVQIK